MFRPGTHLLSPRFTLAMLILQGVLGWGTYFLQVRGGGNSIVGQFDYWIATNGGGSCTYAGTTVSCTPNNSGNCTINTAPCADFPTAYAKAKNFILQAPIKFHFANTAGTGTDCNLTTSETIIDNLAQGGSTGHAYDFSSRTTGGTGLTDSYPTGRIELIGDDTTPTNVKFRGGSSCAATAASALRAIAAVNTNLYVHGITFDYYKGAAVTCGEHGNCFFENVAGTNDNGNAQYAFSAFKSHIRFGGSVTLNGYSFGLNCDGSGCDLDDRTPLGGMNLDIQMTAAFNSAAIEIQEGAHHFMNEGTYVFHGTGTYWAIQGQDGGQVYNNDGGPVSVTVNGSNIKMWHSIAGSYVGGFTCGTGVNNVTVSCPSSGTWATAEWDSTINMAGTNGKGSSTSDNVVNTGSKITYNWFGSGPKRISVKGLPTSSTGLASGEIWSNSNVLTVVP